jgi:hypothetical protein
MCGSFRRVAEYAETQRNFFNFYFLSFNERSCVKGGEKYKRVIQVCLLSIIVTCNGLIHSFYYRNHGRSSKQKNALK